MLSDYEDLNFESVEDAQKAFKKLLSEAVSIKDNADRAVNQRKTDQENYRKEIDELKESIGNLSKTKEELENKGLINEGNFEELLEKKTEKMRLSFEEKLETVMGELNQAKTGYDNLQNKYNRERINSVLRKSAETAGVLPSAIDDVLSRANGVFTIAEDGSIESRDKDGNIRKVRNKQLTPEVFVASLKETATHFWPASESAGAGGGKGSEYDSNPFDKKNWNLTEQARIANENPELAKELQAAAKAA